MEHALRSWQRFLAAARGARRAQRCDAAFVASTGAPPRSAAYNLAVVFGRVVWCVMLWRRYALRQRAARTRAMLSLRQAVGLSFRACSKPPLLCLLVSYRPLANIACLLRVFCRRRWAKKSSLHVHGSLSTPRACPLHIFCRASSHSQLRRAPHCALHRSPSAETSAHAIAAARTQSRRS